MSSRRAAPQVVVIAGPNGAGKSTVAPKMLRDVFEVEELVNADTIAAGLSALRPESVAVAAGRIMLRRMRDLAARRTSFGFETTLASRRFAPWLARLQRDGWRVRIVFVRLMHPDLAIARVRQRVRAGGHDVAAATIRRRFHRGAANLAAHYRPCADEWVEFDNSVVSGPTLVGHGRGGCTIVVHDERHRGPSGSAPRRREPRGTVAVIASARRAVAEALETHRALGWRVAEWRGGRVDWVPANEDRARRF